MKTLDLHPWQVTTSQARDIQLGLAEKVCRCNKIGEVRLVAGADISAPRGAPATGAVVVLSYPALEPVEVRVVRQALSFPYVPGLLTFREAPLVIEAWRKLTLKPDLLLVDGQGLAHPRRMGIASHLGLLVDIPTIGCAKSRLIGEHGPVGDEAGSRTELRDGDEVIGAVLRTRAGSRPLYVSIGHKVDLNAAVEWVLKCCRGHRLPEPSRLAHLAAGGNLAEMGH